MVFFVIHQIFFEVKKNFFFFMMANFFFFIFFFFFFFFDFRKIFVLSFLILFEKFIFIIVVLYNIIWFYISVFLRFLFHNLFFLNSWSIKIRNQCPKVVVFYLNDSFWKSEILTLKSYFLIKLKINK